MATNEQIQMLRGIVDKKYKKYDDDILIAYLDMAERKILNRTYPYKDFENLSMPKKYEGLQVEIAAYMINKRGAEGEIQHIENGTHRNYGSADVPDDMLSEIVPFCGVIE